MGDGVGGVDAFVLVNFKRANFNFGVMKYLFAPMQSLARCCMRGVFERIEIGGYDDEFIYLQYLKSLVDNLVMSVVGRVKTSTKNCNFNQFVTLFNQFYC